MHITVNSLAAKDDARIVVFELGNCFLIQHKMVTDMLGLKPVPALVLLTVAISTVQKYMRLSPPDTAHRGATPLPDALSGGISRRAIARSTGLPTETVRRCVEDLVALGRLEILSAQKVRTPPGSISWATAEGIETILGAVARQAESLSRAGVLEIRPARRTAGEQIAADSTG